MRMQLLYVLCFAVLSVGACSTTSNNSTNAKAEAPPVAEKPVAVATAENERLPLPDVFTDAEKSEMSLASKVAEYNRTRPEKDHIICTRERVTGSHRKAIFCATRAERAELKDGARTFFQYHNNAPGPK